MSIRYRNAEIKAREGGPIEIRPRTEVDGVVDRNTADELLARTTADCESRTRRLSPEALRTILASAPGELTARLYGGMDRGSGADHGAAATNRWLDTMVGGAPARPDYSSALLSSLGAPHLGFRAFGLEGVDDVDRAKEIGRAVGIEVARHDERVRQMNDIIRSVSLRAVPQLPDASFSISRREPRPVEPVLVQPTLFDIIAVAYDEHDLDGWTGRYGSPERGGAYVARGPRVRFNVEEFLVDLRRKLHVHGECRRVERSEDGSVWMLGEFRVEASTPHHPVFLLVGPAVRALPEILLWAASIGRMPLILVPRSSDMGDQRLLRSSGVRARVAALDYLVEVGPEGRVSVVRDLSIAFATGHPLAVDAPSENDEPYPFTVFDNAAPRGKPASRQTVDGLRGRANEQSTLFIDLQVGVVRVDGKEVALYAGQIKALDRLIQSGHQQTAQQLVGETYTGETARQYVSRLAGKLRAKDRRSPIRTNQDTQPTTYRWDPPKGLTFV